MGPTVLAIISGGARSPALRVTMEKDRLLSGETTYQGRPHSDLTCTLFSLRVYCLTVGYWNYAEKWQERPRHWQNPTRLLRGRSLSCT